MTKGTNLLKVNLPIFSHNFEISKCYIIVLKRSSQHKNIFQHKVWVWVGFDTNHDNVISSFKKINKKISSKGGWHLVALFILIFMFFKVFTCSPYTQWFYSKTYNKSINYISLKLDLVCLSIISFLYEACWLLMKGSFQPPMSFIHSTYFSK